MPLARHAAKSHLDGWRITPSGNSVREKPERYKLRKGMITVHVPGSIVITRQEKIPNMR
jgi:hypothetical protein